MEQSASAKIDARIAGLGDWRGKALAARAREIRDIGRLDVSDML